VSSGCAVFTYADRAPLSAPMKLIEVRYGVVRAGCRLRVILHPENWQGPVPQPLDSAVVQVDVRDLELGSARDAVRLGAATAKPWFCDVMSTLPVARSFTG
jgi:hypothetical protein